MRTRLFAIFAVLLICGSDAAAQFDTPGTTQFRERLAGTLRVEEGGPVPEPGDQLGAFFRDQLVGAFTFTSDSQTDAGFEFSLTVSGDDPGTSEVEGPSPGDRVELRFFDSSSNTVFFSLRGKRPGSEENFNYTFNGQFIPPELDGFPIDIPLEPTAPVDFLLTADVQGTGDGPGGSGGGGNADFTRYDVNGDGKIDSRDIAFVLRFVVGRTVPGDGDSPSARADVDGDGIISTQDAIEIIRNGR